MFSCESYRDAHVSLLFEAQFWNVRCGSLAHGMTKIRTRRAPQSEYIPVLRADTGLGRIELIEESEGRLRRSFKIEGIEAVPIKMSDKTAVLN